MSWKSSVDKAGAYKRKVSSFRHTVTADGSSGFKAESGRYHLYVSYACPWANRTLVSRELKGLQDCISVTVVDWHLGPGGWRFCDDKPGCTRDPLNGFEFLREVYRLNDEDYQGNVTVPVLFDKRTNRIVNNESSEIIRMLNSEFNAFCSTPAHVAVDLYPVALRSAIDAVNDWVYPNINNGVYRAGFAQSQEAYEDAFDSLFSALDDVEAILSRQRYLVGDGSCFTEADVRLFTTLIRFDAVYVQHFKCNLRTLKEYPNTHAYTREIYQMPGVADTVDFQHIKHHYMGSHKTINPLGIVPRGPLLDFDSEHGRGRQFPLPSSAASSS